MPSFSFAKIAGGLAVTAVMLAGCVVVEDGPGHRPPPPRPGGPTACTFEYAPVCGERRGDRQTFSNACLARADGYRVAYGGQCRASRPDRPGPGPERPPRPRRPHLRQRLRGARRRLPHRRRRTLLTALAEGVVQAAGLACGAAPPSLSPSPSRCRSAQTSVL